MENKKENKKSENISPEYDFMISGKGNIIRFRRTR